MNFKFRMTCREVTYHFSKVEEGKLPLLLRLKIYLHTFYCGPCKRFIRQTRSLTAYLRKIDLGRFSGNVPDERKDKMKQAILDFKKNNGSM